MTTIAMVQGKDQRDRVFAQAHIEQLRLLGEVVLNERSGPPSEDEVRELATGADVIITSWQCPPITAAVLDAAPQLRGLLHAAGSVKGVATPEVWRRGIRVSGGAAALGKGVAETALGMTIASLKNMWRLARHTREGGWTRGTDVRELYGLTIGVVSAGSAGGHFIRLLQNFDVDVLVYDPFLSAEDAAALGAVKSELEPLLAAADVVSLHAPLLDATHHMINARRLALMKDDAILINTARGGLIDETALAAELAQGRLFACLDVTDPEPPAADHPLRALPNAVLTPHLAGAVTNGLHRIARSIVDDAALLLQDKPMRGEVAPERLDRLA
ncbi:hydroxyacid dehydrogenase [Paenibacillus cymbidii]|uniref:hydroxyacid dehydrogenase n=1 Tax=Paenibacillus cymbidii TaxID=1639034 RepID=UPI0010812887|nr:hydroxyacid dehydrogenase [Paenibacillus cymbidii]